MDACQRVAQWALADVLLAYEARERDRLLTLHQHHELIAVFGGYKDGKVPPLPPWVMRDD